MKKRALILPLLLFLSLATQLSAQSAPENLTLAQADDLALTHCRSALYDYANSIERSWLSRRLKSNDYQMPFEYYINGDLPERGYPLYISLHGGGATSAEENNQQWENQKSLYGIVNGIYFVPRSPTDTWDMWHQGYMEDFLLQIVSYSVAKLGADPSRVYLLGYSAGGDGVYNLATRLCDRFAAAAMMAGHPGDAQIENLRSLPFAIYVGANDTAYNRAGLAYEWVQAYQRLNEVDPEGFVYNINIFADKGHWMDGLDGVAIEWLASYRRVSMPHRFIWIQDDVLGTRRYNLEVSNPKQGYRVEQIIESQENRINIYSEHYDEVTIWLDDYMVSLDKPVVVKFNDREVFNGMVLRTEQNIIDCVAGRYDLQYVYWGKIVAKRGD